MKTIGKVLKDARVSKKISLPELKKRTKIKVEFIKFIEEERWNELPEYATVQGFVKSLGKSLNLNEEKMAALFRRDYPPKDLPINPKQDVSKKFVWSPKTSLTVGALFAFLVVGSYLGFQYKRFVRPPEVKIESPIEGQEVDSLFVMVSGSTDKDVVIVANNQPLLVDEDGNFSDTLEVSKETSEIKIVAISRSGKETVIYRKITVEVD